MLAENDSNAAALSIKVADLRRANLKIEEQGRALEAKEKELEAHGERAKEQEDRLQMYSRQGDANKKCEDQARQGRRTRSCGTQRAPNTRATGGGDESWAQALAR